MLVSGLHLALAHGFSRWFLPLAVLVTCLGPAGAADDGKEKDERAVSVRFGRLLVKALTIIEEEHYSPPSKDQMARWSIAALYAQCGKEVPLDLKKRLSAEKPLQRKELQEALAEARWRLGDREALKGNGAFEISIDAVFAKLDGRSAYERWAWDCVFRDGNAVGVGLQLESDPATRMVRVVTPVFQGPAYKSGLRAGDLITHIRVEKKKALEETTWESHSTKGMSVERAQALLIGPEGSRVTIIAIPAKTR